MRYKEYVKDKHGKIIQVKTKKKPAAITLLEKEKTRQKFLRQIIALQDGLGFDPITIPFMNLSLSDYKATVDQVNAALSVKDKEAVFFLDMAYPYFTELLRYITSAKGSRLIGIFYRQYHKRVQEYETLYSYRKKDVLFVMAEIDRYATDMADVSSIHMLPFLANDVMVVEFPAAPMMDENDEAQVEKFRYKQSLPVDTRIRGFNSEELSVREIGSLIGRKEMLLSEVDKPGDSALMNMLDNYTDATSDADNFKALNSFFRVHEIVASSKELDRLHPYIRDQAGLEYVKEKPLLSNALGQLREGTLDKHLR
jgi:hypothetical protein